MIPETEKITRRSFNQHPQFFGAYFNMARHNVYLICKHIAEKFDEKQFRTIGFSGNLDDDELIDKQERNFVLYILIPSA